MTSIWFDQALAAEGRVEPTPLDGDLRADVAIVGGGYTGLWTAIELKSRKPGLDVVVIERDLCGSGASSRNLGFAVTSWVQADLLAKMAGEEEALRLCRASVAAVDEIAGLQAAHGIDVEIDRRGYVWTATAAMQAGHWDRTLAVAERYQVRDYRLLSAAEVGELTGQRSAVAGVLDRGSALLQPGRLVRGLRRLALKLGVRIFESTPMIRLLRGHPPGVVTPRGTVTADKVILAIYAWSMAVPELRPAIMVMGTDAVMTKPVPELIGKAGWTGAPGVTDSRILVEGQRITPRGEVVWTKAGGNLPYGSRIDGAFARPRRDIAEMRELLRANQPQLADAPLQGTWSGPIERTWDGLPLFGALPTCPDILYGFGYSGAGLVLSRIGSRILASLALGERDEWSGCALVRPPRRAFPPEPIRYIGAHMVRTAIERKDRLDHEGRPTGPVTNFLLKFKPASYKSA